MTRWRRGREQKTLRRLDLSGFVKPFNRGGVVLASVFARQEGLPPSAAKRDPWRCIGIIAAEDAALPLAVARQRKLIEAWSMNW